MFITLDMNITRHLIFGVLLCITACLEYSTGKSEQWWTNQERQYIIDELNRTTEELRLEIESLSETQWFFKEDPDRWSIAEIIEHLEMQNQLHYREIAVISKSPQMPEYGKITQGQDYHFVKYATDTIKGTASWFLEPLGRFCTKESGENAFYRARGNLLKFVEQTDVDLRKQFTFRASTNNMKFETIQIGQVRDLHQLLLTGIAHTDRHLSQIRTIKSNPNFPE